MKLLNCLECHDIVALMFHERKCICGLSKGRYTNTRQATYSGPSRILGMRNGEYAKAKPGPDYAWFVIPDGNNIKRMAGNDSL